MATLKEYYQKDQGRTLLINRDLSVKGQSGNILLEVPARLHLDFEANALYISFYIPHTTEVQCPARILLNSIEDILAWRNEVHIEGGTSGEDKMRSTEMKFTGRMFIYSEDPIESDDKDYIRRRAEELGHSVKFREQAYADQRNKYEKPLAFISHDSGDKQEIAAPLALQLQKLMCPVWYDDYSLKVGDSLRAQIEKGLKECRKCILVLTPRYLSNEGWGKREFDSIFTRELIESKNVILPVWSGVSKNEVYEYSPALADRVAAKWGEGVEEVARKLRRAIE